MTQSDLESLFSPYGKIITSRILCDNITGKLQYKQAKRVKYTYLYYIYTELSDANACGRQTLSDTR